MLNKQNNTSSVKSLWDKEPPKMPLNLFCVCHLLGKRTVLDSGLYTQCTLEKKLFFIYKLLLVVESIVGSLCIRVEYVFITSPSFGTTYIAERCSTWSCWHTFYEFIITLVLLYIGFISWCLLSPWILQSISLLFHMVDISAINILFMFV